MRGAIPSFKESPISPDELAGIACEREAPSRIIVQHPGDAEKPWELASATVSHPLSHSSSTDGLSVDYITDGTCIRRRDAAPSRKPTSLLSPKTTGRSSSTESTAWSLRHENCLSIDCRFN